MNVRGVDPVVGVPRVAIEKPIEYKPVLVVDPLVRYVLEVSQDQVECRSAGCYFDLLL